MSADDIKRIAAQWDAHWQLISTLHPHDTPQDRLFNAVVTFMDAHLADESPGGIVAGISAAQTHSRAALTAAFERLRPPPRKKLWRPLRIYIAGSVLWAALVACHAALFGHDWNTDEQNRAILWAILPPVLAALGWTLGRWATSHD